MSTTLARARSGLYIPRSAAAFPTIPTSAAGRIISAKQANITGVRTFPDLSGLTKNAGDLLIAICGSYGSNTSGNFDTWGSGWTEFADIGNSGIMVFGCAYKWSDGTETGTFSVTERNTISGQADMLVMSIPGAHPTSPPEVTAGTSATTGTANPPALTPSWGLKDTLWIPVAGNGATGTSGTFDGITGAPASYGNLYAVGPSQSPANVAGVVDLAVAFRQLTAASEDPAGFTVDTSTARNSAFTIAVRPAA